ncbi:MAG: peptide transporter, partial [Verrucomicrobiae bacterium]|nr:peptide transporter [Verrucomicrobiae bacterium]
MSRPGTSFATVGSSTRSSRVDRELEEFRQLVEPAATFEEGFTWPAFFGALFVALLMVPGAMYMSLIAGGGHGITQAAQWVTVILFIEVARRANKVLKRAEIFTLFYLAGAAIGTPFAGVLWQQFYAQSDAARAAGITEWLPHWYAPRDADVLSARSLLRWEWLPAIALVVFSTFLTRIDNMILGYGLFRVASDIERLPFPMAPIGAQGVLALSDEQEEERVSRDMDAEPMKPTSWRWRVFAVGGVLGLIFGALYLGLPTVTGALVGKPVVILPIPFVDWTQKTSSVLPAVAMNLSFDASNILFGMVLPFFSMLGSFIGLVLNIIANPILYRAGILSQWNPADGAVVTVFKNYVDFFFSFQIGLSLAIAATGIVAVVRG